MWTMRSKVTLHFHRVQVVFYYRNEVKLWIGFWRYMQVVWKLLHSYSSQFGWNHIRMVITFIQKKNIIYWMHIECQHLTSRRRPWRRCCRRHSRRRHQLNHILLRARSKILIVFWSWNIYKVETFWVMIFYIKTVIVYAFFSWFLTTTQLIQYAQES